QSFGSLTLVAMNDDDATGGTTSRLVFDARAGVSYAIAVDGITNGSGDIRLDLEVEDTSSRSLKIERSGKNITLPWPANLSGGAIVEWTPSLSVAWARLESAPVIVGEQYFHKLSSFESAGFF